jgi:hypothetical protein
MEWRIATAHCKTCATLIFENLLLRKRTSPLKVQSCEISTAPFVFEVTDLTSNIEIDIEQISCILVDPRELNGFKSMATHLVLCENCDETVALFDSDDDLYYLLPTRCRLKRAHREE